MSVAKIDDKLELYGKKVPGIRAYANGWVFVALLFAVWHFVGVDLGAVPLYDTAINAGYLSFTMTAAITIRTPDKAALSMNLAFLCYLAAYYIYQTVLLFTTPAQVVGAVSDTISSATVLGGLTVLAAVLFFCIFYIGVFVGHRKFFVLTAKELRTKTEP